MQLRHALIPYIYSMAWRVHRTGISLVTPMYYGNMEDASAYEAKDQYFFGSELLVAPILKACDPKRLAIYFTKHSSPDLHGDKEHTNTSCPSNGDSPDADLAGSGAYTDSRRPLPLSRSHRMHT